MTARGRRFGLHAMEVWHVVSIRILAGLEQTAVIRFPEPTPILMKQLISFCAVTAALIVSAAAEGPKLTAHDYAKAGEWKIVTMTDESGKYVCSRAARQFSETEGLRVTLNAKRDTIDFRGPGTDGLKEPFPVTFWFSAGINSTPEEEAAAIALEAKPFTAKTGRRWARIIEPKTGPGSIDELAKAGMIHIKFNGRILHYDLTKSAAAMKILMDAHRKKSREEK
jgi:hypothetical protein